ncbi:hypothetical protein PENSPDRAFT_365512 [Peniophora sp. CONT]|nr:hypothetical protein PENSPDRAFT_365512 [Peniophora sp. CONT]
MDPGHLLSVQLVLIPSAVHSVHIPYPVMLLLDVALLHGHWVSLKNAPVRCSARRLMCLLCGALSPGKQGSIARLASSSCLSCLRYRYGVGQDGNLICVANGIKASEGQTIRLIPVQT